jgi:hypothetical protein
MKTARGEREAERLDESRMPRMRARDIEAMVWSSLGCECAWFNAGNDSIGRLVAIIRQQLGIGR